MKLELVSFALCPFVHRATTMLREKGCAFEIRYIDLKRKPDWFLAISPRGRVPVLLADGTAIFESAVINEFLDETQPPRLLPDDPFERARQRAWVEVANDLFAANYDLRLAKTPADLDAGIGKIGAILGRFEEAVRGPFFAGEAFGLVDAAVAPAFYRFAIVEARTSLRLYQGLPKVAAWAHALATRPSVAKGVPPEFEDVMIALLRESGGVLGTRLR